MSVLNKFLSLSVGFSVLVAGQAFAGLKEDFNSINSWRGPFGKNVIQSTGARKITSGSAVVGKRLFQGAFRSSNHGRPLAKEYGFYIGNLMPSNYYELMHEYVFKDKYKLDYGANDTQNEYQSYSPYRSLDEAALIKAGKAAMPRAYSMARHTVLEKYYMKRQPNSKLTKSFLRWGVGDSKDEGIYTEKFINLYLSSISSDLQFTPLFFLLRESPVGDSSQLRLLERARDLVAGLPHDSSALGRIRNAIHNQLSPAVIKMIDQYTATYGYNSTLASAKRLIVDFYSFGIGKIASTATKHGFKEIAAAAKAIDKSSTWASIELLNELSTEMTKLKQIIDDNSKVRSSKKTDALLMLSYITQFLNARFTNTEVYKKEELSSQIAFLSILDILYAEGLLIENNWVAFKKMIANTSDHRTQALYLRKAISTGTDTVIKSFKEPLDQWKSVYSGMEDFTDSAVKSSGLNTASVVVGMVN